MAVRVLFTYDYGVEKMEKIRLLGYDVQIKPEKGLVYTEDLEGTEVLVCYDPFETFDIARIEALRWIQLSSIGIDQLEGDKVKKAGITVTNNRGGYSIPMGEWIVMNILELYKNSRVFYKSQENKKWNIDCSVLELYGKTVGFIGTGTIAAEAAKRLQGFGVRILGLNRRGQQTEYFDQCYSSDQINAMLAQCDVVTVAIPSTKETYRLIDESRFAAMKDGAIFINVARGNIIDEAALIHHLKTGKLRGAALDVFDQEPLGEENPLWALENVILTPHNSWVSEMRNDRRFEMIYENLKRYIKGEPLLNLVDIERGY